MTAANYGPTLGRPGSPTPGGPTPSPQPSGPKAPPAPPPPKNAELLDLIDNDLISLLCIAYFGPAEQGTAASVDQACAAEALLGALRAGRNAVRLMRHAYGIQLPARRLAVSPVAGLGSNSVVAEKLRRSARVAVDGAAAATVSPPAGSEGGRAGGQAVLAQSPGAVRDSRLVSDGPSAPGTAAHGGPATPPPGADFSLPRTPRFSMREGDRRLYGGAGMTAPTRAPGCDAESPSVYVTGYQDGEPVYGCRCLICGRCGRHTGNSTQGHFWRWCKVTKQLEEFHSCCPGDCELHPKAGEDE